MRRIRLRTLRFVAFLLLAAVLTAINPDLIVFSNILLTETVFIFLLCAGLVSYVTIPKEAEPDVKIPIIYVQLSQRGISPEDAERLLLRPVETQLKSVGSVKEMRSTAFEGGGFVLLEFEAGFDSKSALADVRAKVDQAKRDLPRDADARRHERRDLRRRNAQAGPCARRGMEEESS